ncbi:MAG TPA: cobalamin-dependent protein [Prolixibacteraceae bacterium]|nr:cobalamin-dependent protein [Prolixibacteraceae bacterium]
MENIHSEIHSLLIHNKKKYAEEIVECQYKKQPESWKKFGESGRQLSIRDAEYHIPFLAEAISANQKEIFTDYLNWVKTLFRGLKFPDSAITENLNCMREVLSDNLREEMAAIVSEFIDAGINKMKAPASIIDSYIDDSTALGNLAREYNNALLNGNRNLAGNLIMDAVKNGVEVKDIYLEVFQKSQYEVGRLWLSNQISVAKEHFCSAATQMIMSQLYPYIFATERVGKKFVGACVGGELHEIGIRMVADFFEMAGWDTYYLGANAPASAILKAVEENEADIIGLSIAMPLHRNLLKETIEEIRKASIGNDLRILIGGAALKEGTRINDFKADGWAPNAQLAIEKANHLIAN